MLGAGGVRVEVLGFRFRGLDSLSNKDKDVCWEPKESMFRFVGLGFGVWSLGFRA